jgi:signal transduction histidine kinase
MGIPGDKLRTLLEVIRQANAETNAAALAGLVCRQACAVLDADRATLYMLDKSAGELAATVALGLPEQRLRLALHQGVAGLVAARGRALRVDDAQADPRFDASVDARTGYRTHSIACAPVTNRRGDVLGVLEVLNKRAGAFTAEDEEVLALLAGQAGIALANAQLYDGLRTTLDRLSRLMKVGAAISSELDLDALLRTISQTTSHLLQAERSTVFLVDRQKGELWSRVAEGLESTEIRIPLGSGIAGAVASTGASVRIDDAYTDTRFNPEVDRRTGYQTRTILCAPMRNPRGEVIGVFQVLNKRGGSFTPLDEQLLSSLSSQAAVAVENARLHEEVQHAYGELQTLDRMKTDFLNAISHELRTPLAPILGYSEILLSGGMGALSPAGLRGVQAIADSGKRLLSLIESLLAFVRLDQGDMVLRREAVEVHALLCKAIEGFQARAEERKVSLLLDCTADLPPVLADPQELGMALGHLVDNATKFTGPGGHVQVRAHAVREEGQPLAVELAVADDGIGIPEALHARIFDRFYQVDSSLARQFGGVGIGLAVAKQILEAHGSRIEVESEPGKGSTFRFRVPTAG